jgi:hypothetical protein
MKKLAAVIVGCLLALGPNETKAASFTPDMWVYEVTFTPYDVSFDTARGFAQAEASSVGPGLDSSCIVDPISAERVLVSCFSVPKGINYFESLFEKPEPMVQRIGFNSSSVVCSGTSPIFNNCPENEGTISYPGGFFFDFQLDALVGRLSFCGAGAFGGYVACYDLSPADISVEGSEFGGGRGF